MKKINKMKKCSNTINNPVYRLRECCPVQLKFVCLFPAEHDNSIQSFLQRKPRDSNLILDAFCFPISVLTSIIQLLNNKQAGLQSQLQRYELFKSFLKHILRKDCLFIIINTGKLHLTSYFTYSCRNLIQKKGEI